MTHAREEFCALPEQGSLFWVFLFDYILRTHNTGIVDWTPLPPHPLRVVPAIVVIAHVVESSGGLQTLKTNLQRKKKTKRQRLPEH
jgi:hypothetical protein